MMAPNVSFPGATKAWAPCEAVCTQTDDEKREEVCRGLGCTFKCWVVYPFLLLLSLVVRSLPLSFCQSVQSTIQGTLV